MTRFVVRAFSISIDGYGAGHSQDLKNPLGVGGPEIFSWFFPTRTFNKMMGKDGETGVDDDFAAKGFDNIGANIMGRNMFGPIRGEWPDDQWKGWWGDEPPYHTPVFVLTHHARPPLPMKGGTEFHFITGGIEEAYSRAKAAAAGKDVRINGGVSTVRQFLKAGLLDELHLVMAPVILGRGENLFEGLDLRAHGYECASHTPGKRALAHITLRRK
jgi:dihydrofolate reductase